MADLQIGTFRKLIFHFRLPLQKPQVERANTNNKIFESNNTCHCEKKTHGFKC